MPVLNGIEEKYINGIKVDKENDEAFFNDATHSYYNKETMQKYTSVTQIIGKYSEEFNADFWSGYKALEAILEPEVWATLKPALLANKKIHKSIFSKFNIDKAKYEAKKLEILNSYEEKKNVACERGVKIHAEFENSFYNKTNFDFTKFGCSEAKGDFQCKENYYKLDLSRGVYPEFFISIASKDNALRVSGQIDLLIVDENDVYIVDFKSNKEIAKTSFYNKATKSHTMMKFPLNNLQDSTWNHYQLQLSLYAYILQQLRPELNIKKLIIYHVDHDGVETIHQAEYLKNDVERMLKHFKKQIKIKSELDKVKPVQLC